MGVCTSRRQKTTETAAPDIDAVRILLVGPKGAGKSTLRKQLRRLHGVDFMDWFSEDEKSYWKMIIYANALRAMQKAVTMSGATDIPAGALLMERSAATAHDPASLSIASAFGAAEKTKLMILRGLMIEERNIGAGGANTPLHEFLAASEGPLAPLGRVVAFTRIISTTALIKSLLTEPVIQSILEEELHHFDGAAYFLMKFDIITEDDYSPNAEDIVRARAPRRVVEGAGAAAGGTPAIPGVVVPAMPQPEAGAASGAMPSMGASTSKSTMSVVPSVGAGAMPPITAMVEELKFTVQGIEFILYDVADYAELDGVLASLPHSCTISNVIFVADLTAYDKVENEENLMAKTLVDFEMICDRISKASSGSKLVSLQARYGWMDDEAPRVVQAKLHLYLNKLDLFEFAITKKEIRQPRKYFKFQQKYGCNYKEGLFLDFPRLAEENRGLELEYFQRKFLECSERAGVEQMYTHSLCATDVENVKRVFASFLEDTAFMTLSDIGEWGLPLLSGAAVGSSYLDNSRAALATSPLLLQQLGAAIAASVGCATNATPFTCSRPGTVCVDANGRAALIALADARHDGKTHDLKVELERGELVSAIGSAAVGELLEIFAAPVDRIIVRRTEAACSSTDGMGGRR